MNKIGPAFETQSMRRLPKSDLDQHPGIALSRNWPARAGAAPTGLIRLRPPGRAVWGTRWDPNPLTELSSSRRNQSPRTRSCVPPGRGRPRFAQDDGPAAPSRARSRQVQIVQREKTHPVGRLYGGHARALCGRQKRQQRPALPGGPPGPRPTAMQTGPNAP